MTTLPENERILIFDFGAQYGQLIARRVREQNVFCQLVRHDLSAARVAELRPRGLILSGGPASVYQPNAPKCDPASFELGVPVLGICYGLALGGHRVICGLSGGVDSSVTAALLVRAIGPRVACIFVDTGLLRSGEADMVRQTFHDHFRADLRVADARDRFLTALAGVSDPQEKR